MDVIEETVDRLIAPIEVGRVSQPICCQILVWIARLVECFLLEYIEVGRNFGF